VEKARKFGIAHLAPPVRVLNLIDPSILSRIPRPLRNSDERHLFSGTLEFATRCVCMTSNVPMPMLLPCQEKGTTSVTLDILLGEMPKQRNET
jgi:hypothetical protein